MVKSLTLLNLNRDHVVVRLSVTVTVDSLAISLPRYHRIVTGCWPSTGRRMVADWPFTRNSAGNGAGYWLTDESDTTCLKRRRESANVK